MVAVTPQQLFKFLHSEEVTYEEYKKAVTHYRFRVTEEQFNALIAADMKPIVVDVDMAEGYFGGDDIIGFAEAAVNARDQGYSIITWYGSNTEAMLVAVRASEVNVLNTPKKRGARRKVK